MSGITNPTVKFERKADLYVYVCHYTDPQQNDWQVGVVGPAKDAEAFADKRPFTCEAVSLSPEETEIAKSAHREQLAAQESTSTEDKKDEQPIEPQDEQAGLDVTFTLVKLAQASPYHVKFEIDPNTPFTTSFKLKGTDTTANVTIVASQGKAKLTISSGNRSATADSPGTARSASPALATWRVVAKSVPANASATFSLSGDITVT